MLELKHIDKYYNQGTINEMCLFEDFNLTVNENEFVSVVGSNGSGKTTLLNIICGSIPIDSGRIIINGKDISHWPRLSESCYGNLPQYDDPGKYGSGRYKGEAV